MKIDEMACLSLQNPILSGSITAHECLEECKHCQCHQSINLVEEKKYTLEGIAITKLGSLSQACESDMY